MESYKDLGLRSAMSKASKRPTAERDLPEALTGIEEWSTVKLQTLQRQCRSELKKLSHLKSPMIKATEHWTEQLRAVNALLASRGFGS